MPIFTYRCLKCSREFDILVGVNQEKSALACAQCHSRKLQRVFTPFRIGGGRSSGESASSSKCSSCSGGSCATCGG